MSENFPPHLDVELQKHVKHPLSSTVLGMFQVLKSAELSAGAPGITFEMLLQSTYY